MTCSKSFSAFPICEKFLYNSPMSALTKMNPVQRVLGQTLLLNLIVTACKLIWGLMSHSLSMTADGFHSLLDATSNVVGILAMGHADKPADSGHPYGHRKLEAIAAMVISFFIFSAAVQILKEAVVRFLEGPNHTHTIVTPMSYGIMFGTLAINWLVTQYEHRQGLLLQSDLLLADAEHTRSDVYASLAVIGSLVAVQLNVGWLDAVLALVIVWYVGRAGYRIIVRHMGVLMDEAVLDPKQVHPVVLAVPGVVSTHRIRSRGMLDHVFLDLHIQVDPDISLRKAHQLSHQVEEALQGHFNGQDGRANVIDVLVHVEEVGDTDEEHAHDRVLGSLLTVKNLSTVGLCGSLRGTSEDFANFQRSPFSFEISGR